ncbi:MAG: hypothetical protein OEX22_02105 [Cyclobacteriaceae bacterium]|nr:hypothetical protein [Cyclobacteriaceae bacterium]
MYKLFLGFVFLFMSLTTITTYGQRKKEVSKKKSTQLDNAFSPSNKEDVLAAPSKKSKKSKKKKSAHERYEITMEQKVKEFEERMEANAKSYKKQQKEMQKPQYSDPSYFGHKRKPKKRKPGKRKFCEECGIVH